MNQSFELNVKANFEDICGTWTLHGQCGEKTAMRSVPVSYRGIWPNKHIDDYICDLILELRASGPKSAVENNQ